jgi:hypothetical protein
MGCVNSGLELRRSQPAPSAERFSEQQELSGMETRCLCKCIDDCVQAVQHAIDGVADTSARHAPSSRLARLQVALEAARRELADAGKLAHAGEHAGDEVMR